MSPFEAWFQRILVNTCRNRLRRIHRQQVRDLSGDLIVAFGSSDVAAEAATRVALDRAFARLTPDGRIVVVLRYFADLPIGEIALRLGIPAGTVKSRLHYSLRTLGIVLLDIPEGAP